MAKHENLNSLFVGIADAIRSKSGKTDPIIADNFPDEISAIEVGGSGDKEWFNDGDTHIWITLSEGRTSPVLGVCPNGTVTVDWGDGTEPDVLTGTSTSTVKWTPNHKYSAPGDYVIRLTVDGEVGFYGDNTNASAVLRYSTNSKLDNRNRVYRSAIQKIELGNHVTNIYKYAFSNCYSLSAIVIPNSVTNIDTYTFSTCYALRSISIPNSVANIGTYVFNNCHSLASITVPDGLTNIGARMCSSCYSLSAIVIPNSVTSIGGSAFNGCQSMRICDFSLHTAVPTLSDTSSFSGIPDDCEIRVPAALYDEWIAATNWSTYASQIVAV